MTDSTTPAQNRLLAAVLFVAALVVSSTSIDPNDTWWHIRMGQYYVEHGEVPTKDIFSHTAAGAEWYPHEWLSQVILYKTYDWFGFWGIRALNSLMAAITMLALLRFYSYGTKQLIPLLFGIVVIFPDVLGRLNTRPEIFTLALMIGYLSFFIFRDRTQLPAARTLVVVGLIAALWANLHGMALLGLIFSGIYIAGEFAALVVRKYVQLPEWNGVNRRAIAGDLMIFGVFAVAVMASPLGFRIYEHAYEGRSFLPGPLGIMEWLSPFRFLGGMVHTFLSQGFPWINIELAWQFLFLAIPIAFFFSLPVLAGRRQLPHPGEILVALFAIYQGAAVVRFRWLFFIPIFFIIRAVSRQRTADEESRPAVDTYLLSPLMVLLIACGAYMLFTRDINFKRAINHDEYPIGIANFLVDLKSSGKLFNTYNWGGYLIFRLFPDYPVFIDGRTDLYALSSKNLMLDHVVIDNQGQGYENLLSLYDVDFLIGYRRDYFPGPELSEEYRFVEDIQRQRTTGKYEISLRNTAVGVRDSAAADSVQAEPEWVKLLANREGSIYLRNNAQRSRQMGDARRFFEQKKIPFDRRSGPDLAAIVRDHPKLAVKYNLLSDEMVRRSIESRADSTSDKSIANRIEIADALINLEFYTDGILLLQSVLNVDRYNPDALMSIARTYHLLGQNEKAYDAITRLSTAGPNETGLAFSEHLKQHRTAPVLALPKLPPLSILAEGWASTYP